MGFFDWLRNSLRRLRGESSVPEQQPPVPEPYPYQDVYEFGNRPEDFEEEPQPIPPEEVPEQLDECNVFHDDGGQRGKVYVYPRWRAINPTIDCIRDMFRLIGYRASYALIICGSPSSEYPGHEGESDVCLTYKYEGNFLRSIVSHADLVSAQDFATAVNDEYPERLVDGWDTCTEVSILDERE